jgi:hypothetical protein
MRIVLGFILLAADPSSCNPASLGSTDYRPGDGGVWLGSGDAAVLVDDSSDLPGGEVVKDLPPMETLCMLFIGDWGQKSDYDTAIGTWINDVQDPRMLGPADPKSISLDSDGARISYAYRKPGTKDEKVSVSLTFEKITTIDANGAQRAEDGKAVKFGGMDGVTLTGPSGLASSGKAWPDPFFLTRATAIGLDKQPLCWDPAVRWSDTDHWTDCPWCKQLGTDYLLCSAAVPRDCFIGH